MRFQYLTLEDADLEAAFLELSGLDVEDFEDASLELLGLGEVALVEVLFVGLGIRGSSSGEGAA